MSYDGERWVLVETATGRTLEKGSQVRDKEGNTATVTYLMPPHRPDTSGRVELNGPLGVAVYYASVINAVYVDTDRKVPVCPLCYNQSIRKESRRTEVWSQEFDDWVTAPKTAVVAEFVCQNKKHSFPYPAYIYAQPQGFADGHDLGSCGYCGEVDKIDKLNLSEWFTYLCNLHIDQQG